MRKIFRAVSIALVIWVPQGVRGGTVYVDKSGQYYPWAYKLIQQGIDAASDGDTVQVMGMQPPYPENIHIHGKDIVVSGAGLPQIHGVGNGPVVTFAGTENETCRLHGFVIQGGMAENGGGICGGGEANHTLATISGNIIAGNEAGHAGGGIAYCDGDIVGNNIAQNHAEHSGGGLYDCDGTISGNSILANSCNANGGGLFQCDGLIRDNVICENSADYGGGLRECWGAMERNVISGNYADVFGGGLFKCHGKIRNNIITANRTFLGGGGLYDCDGIIGSNTICGNSALRSGGGLDGCGGQIINCIIWGNGGNEESQIINGDTPVFSCIENWSGGGVGNISEDPQFLDPDGPDDDPDTYEDNSYRLSLNSPCVDAGWTENWMWQGTDKDNNPRVFYGRVSKTVDMGAYEFGSWHFKILSIESEPGLGVLLSWRGRTTALTQYTVWSTSDVSFGELVQETAVTSIHTPVYWRDTTSGGHRKFYKVEIE